VANPLAVSLAPAGAQVAGGTGASVDIGTLRKALRLELVVTALTAGPAPELQVELETSEDGVVGWRPVAAFSPVTALGTLEQTFGPVARYVRVTWVLVDITSVTFTLTGAAHVMYAEPKHIRSLGIKGPALQNVADADLVEYCVVSSTEADGYLGKGHTLPLAAWGFDLRLHCAKLAVYHYLNAKGRVPTGPDDIIDLGYAQAIRWLGGVGGGKIVPPELVDSTPEEHEFAYAVESEPSRDWHGG
jgi:phage gp36-like protein